MSALAAVFWGCLLLVAYTYLLYPCLLFAVYSVAQVRRDWKYLTTRRNRRRPCLPSDALPAVSLVIPAHNEEACLPGKITNLRQLDYPRDRLDVVVVSDGSTDRTNEILGTLEDPQVQTVFLTVRRGKSTALNHGVARARHDILVFSDAATLFSTDALRQLVRHFVDPTVGVVCGALEFQGSDESRKTEGIYWTYEGMIRLMEARLGATLTASGAIYALRRRCYRPLSADVLIEDFVIPMNARRRGYRVLYDPEARGTEVAATSVPAEFTRRVRLAVGSFRALHRLMQIPFHPVTYLAFFSHKLLRWVLPFLLIGLLASSGALSHDPLYRVAFIGQLLFYLWAAAGFLFRERLGRVRFGLVGYYLCAIHLAFLVGFLRVLTGRTDTAWQRG